jgi:hypothetical protein
MDVTKLDVTKLIEEGVAVGAVAGVACVAAHLLCYDQHGRARASLAGRYTVGTLAIGVPWAWWASRVGHAEAIVVWLAAAAGAGAATVLSHWIHRRLQAAVAFGMEKVYEDGTVPVPFRKLDRECDSAG